jgi:alpha-1,6-mannosyltransferase
MPEANTAVDTDASRWGYWLLASGYVLLLAGGLFLPREQFGWLLGWQVGLYVLLGLLYKWRLQWSLKQIVIMAIVARLVAALIPPQLSDDIYRFIWDGQLIAHGYNPLLSTPNGLLPSLQKEPAYFTQLHGLINHPQHYTCYPPLMQGICWVGAKLGGYHLSANIIWVKLIIALADSVAVILLIKILRRLQLPTVLVILYAFNPAVIIEGSGNAHFEIVQVCLMVAAIFCALHQRFWLAAFWWGLAIVTKLLPLLLLPIWIKKWGWKKGLLFSLVSCAVAAITFIPFVSIDFLTGFGKSLNLYFQNFEFNASVYYIARQIGWWVKGYNYIHFIGPLLMGIFLALYAFLFFTKKKQDWQGFAKMAIVVLTLYYLLATTVHPWYIINLLPFALMAGWRYPIVWCGAAFFSYHAYGPKAFAENFWMIALEYGVVVVAILFEWRREVRVER